MTDAVQRLSAALAGRYRIERELGQGGMATVYLAEDVKHRRKVAVKVLRPELAAVVGAQRFLSEIETTANLQHPHILPLFDSGEADSFLFYVMPFIEGESLRERLDREKQLPVEESVRIASAVAGALQHAHERGVIHRDIKPANILLAGGEPLVADFGIALAVSQAGGGRLTETGLSLGTPHYMSPEQATGERTVDPRSDVYALGCVLYEMLAGHAPHVGPTAQAVLAKILTGEVSPVREARPSVPANVDGAVQKCLEKLPADRFASAREFARALADSGFRHRALDAGARTTPDGARWKSLAIGMTAIAVASAAVSIWSALPDPSETAANLPATTRFTLDLDQPLAAWVSRQIAISRDGRIITYTAFGDDGPQLFVRHADRFDAGDQPIPSTIDAVNPFFSPDGEWLGFVDREGIKRVSLDGGQPTLIVAAPRAFPLGNAALAADWGDDDSIRYVVQDGLYQVGASGGGRRMVARADSLFPFVWPELLPESRGILFTKGSEVWVLDLESLERKLLIPDGVDAHYVRDGYLVYGHVASQSVLAAPFDLGRLEVTGSHTTVLSGVRVHEVGPTQLAISDNGTVLYAAEERRRFVIADLSGTVEEVPLAPSRYWNVRFSPDGRTLAYAETPDLVLYDRITGATRRLPFEDDAVYPVWSPKGDSLAAASGRFGTLEHRDLFLVAADQGSPVRLLEAAGIQQPHDWSSDGRYLVYDDESAGNTDIHVLDLSSRPPTTRPFLTSSFNEVAPVLSPNAQGLAYSSDETGRYEVYLRSFPNPGERIPVSLDGGTEPVWSPDGRTIYFRSHHGRLVAARVDWSGSPRITARDPLLDITRYVAHPYSMFANYDVHPDGRRFVMVADDAGSRITVVVNWFEELRQRMAAAGRAN